ncbi:hypothetical protein [Jannaschia sp. CCS1]|uniref:hypothetical protein n=1 Tax=Jannaschia sp. (strain CCS1) TaxID=290400 RepID=UPI0000539FB6|nr:hypothetical protein [Jannaschia sp. CCS1]ABD52960.1 hypothetical protein Jann_0043 [Jannaschia sp. CCS1]
MRFTLLITGALVCAGCTPAAAPSGRAAVPETCEAARLQTLVGQNVRTMGALPNVHPLQLIGPGAEPVQALRPDRTHAYFDADGVVVSVACG